MISTWNLVNRYRNCYNKYFSIKLHTFEQIHWAFQCKGIPLEMKCMNENGKFIWLKRTKKNCQWFVYFAIKPYIYGMAQCFKIQGGIYN